MLGQIALVEVGNVVEMRVSNFYVAVGLVNVAEDVGLWLDLLNALEQTLAANIFSGKNWFGNCIQNAKRWRVGD